MAVSIYLASVLGLAPYRPMVSSPIALASLKLTLAPTTADTNNTSLTTMQAAVDPPPQPVNPMNHLFT